MKKILITVLGVLAVAGCGSQEPQDTKFMGTTPQSASNGTNYIEEGMKSLEQKNVANAIKDFDQAIKNDPMNPENYLVLGQVYLRLTNYKRATDTLNAATRIAPNNGDVYFMLATAEVLRAENGDRERAIEHAKRSVEIFMKEKNATKVKLAGALLQDLMGKKTPTTQQ